MPVASYSKSGAKATTAVKLDSEIFGIDKINHQLLHQAYDAYLANGRVNLAQTKTRGLVRGSGRKPWRQKGTGRARVGARSTPLWRGGGIVFGPTGQENYSRKLNSKSKQSAIRHALSAQRNILKVIEDISLKTSKTSELIKLLAKIDATGYTLVVSDTLSDELKLASRNNPSVKVVAAKYLNVARILDADTIVMTKPALEVVDEWLKPKPKAKAVK